MVMAVERSKTGITLDHAKEQNKEFDQEIFDEIIANMANGMAYEIAMNKVLDDRGYFNAYRREVAERMDKLHNSG